jgi:hypothetical protein
MERIEEIEEIMEDYEDKHNPNSNNNEDVYDVNNIEHILNVFIIYYKKTFPDSKLNHFFDNIVQYDDTNKIMEHFYECINDYKASKYKSSIDYNETEILDEGYILNVNNQKIKMSDNVFSLLIDIINSYSSENWFITEI